MSGWIKLHRQIQEHWLWQEKPFDKKSAWIDLILSANHKDNKFLLGNELVEVKRGSFITSEYKLMERWGWSKTKVRNFLELLESENMIIKESDRKKTTLNIVSYSDYQVSETTKELPKDYGKTTKELLKNSNKNDKNVKNDNKDIYISIVEYLNQKCNKNFRHSTKTTQRFIDARTNEGFTLDDFKKVIDIKSSQWLGGEMEQYLRPQTLFGTKFESYLNENQKSGQNKNNKPSQKTKFHNFAQRTSNYTEDQLEEIARRKREEYFNKNKGD